jgi:16S rRNA G527 N7-methylase RsmG
LEWLIPALIGLTGTVIGVIGKGIYDQKGAQLSDSAKIRQELREDLNSLRQTLKEVEAELHDAKRKEIDMDIALSRAVSRLDECAEIIGLLLQAEEKLDQGDVRKARMILALIEQDKKMRRELKLD